MSARPVIRQLAQLDDFATLSDASANVASLRTLGTGEQQAAAGNHGHVASAITSGVFPIARLATGTPDGSKFIRDDGTLQPVSADLSTAPILAPATSTRNLTVPTADATAHTWRAFSTQTNPLLLVEDTTGQDVLRLTVPAIFTPGNNAHAVRLEMPSTGVGTNAANTRYNGVQYGPVGITFTGQTYTGEPDPCIFIGYNVKAFEDDVVPVGGYACWGVEGNAFWSAPPYYRHEMYAELTNEDLTVGFRPLFVKMDTEAGGTPSTRFKDFQITGNPLDLGVANDTAPFTPGTCPHTLVLRLSKGATLSALTVTGATNATPIVVTTSASHGLVSGQHVLVAGVGGNTAANGGWRVTVLSATTFSLNTSVGNGAYTSGGTVTPSAINQLQATGQAVFTSTNAASPSAIYTSDVTLTSAIAEFNNLNSPRVRIFSDGRVYVTGTGGNGYVEVDPGDVQATAFLARRNGTNAWYVDTEGHTTWKDGAGLSFGTTNGTKIGTATTQKIGFWNKAPVVQPTGIADASTAHALNVVFTDTEVEAALNALGTKINAIITALESVGLLATV